MSHLRYFLYNLLVVEAEVYGLDEARNRYVGRLWSIIEGRPL